jgi:hypothetical protein
MPWSSRQRRRFAALLAAALLSPSLVSAPAFAQATADAKASLADGDKAARAKDWSSAAKLYDAANKTQPSSEALEGLANAEYQGGQLGEAHADYTEWLAKYGAKAPAAKKKTAETRLKELGEKTGSIILFANESGAAVIVDDKQVGVTPLAAPIRVSAGAHHLRVTKAGFAPFDQSPNVNAGGAATLTVTLAPGADKGKLVVKEKTGKPVRVTVDNIDMGDAPWTGDVDPGQHSVGARATGLFAPPQRVNVQGGKTQEIELTASSSSAPVKIGTSDGKGLIYLDGKLVGEGSFVGDIPSGAHALRITREGYDPFEEEINVKDKEPLARTVTLKINSKIETGTAEVVERTEGIYGGFAFLAMFTPGGTGNDIQKTCAGAHPPELVSCDAPDGFGGGFSGFIGYHWDPVGIELFLAAQYDQRTMKMDWNAASTDLGFGPDPARREDYKLRRAGGMALARARLTLQGPRIRFTAALGAGLSKRYMFLQRDTTAKDSADRDLYVSDTASYWSPVVAIEPAVMFRITPGTAIGVGLQLFLDTPATFLSGNPKGENPRSNRESGHALGQVPVQRGLTTNAMDLASNLQVFVGPYIGMMFGP